MSLLKENEEKRSRKEERENQQQQQRLATPSSRCPVDNSVDKNRRANLMHHACERGILRKDIEDAAKSIGMSATEVNDWLEYMETIGWRMSNGHPVNGCNFRRPLRMWHIVQMKIDERQSRREQNRREHRIKQEEAERLRRLQKVAAKPEAWALCIERCANAKECGGCKCNVPYPPMLETPRSRPPEECAEFEQRVE